MLADFAMFNIFTDIAERRRRRLLFQWILFLTSDNIAGSDFNCLGGRGSGNGLKTWSMTIGHVPGV